MNGADWPISDTHAAFLMAGGFFRGMSQRPLPAPGYLGLRCAEIQVRPSWKRWFREPERSGH
ncbi:hypothetical protein [Mesorhizobium sp. LjNodule214]|uniref:hypothetical protein n=1 Tax=Mesorhizobium sp. LjNodule214 TaxID=3342252 RepID=UPI003ED120FE